MYVTQHAIDRWVERGWGADPDAAITEIRAAAEAGNPRVMFDVDGETVLTVYPKLSKEIVALGELFIAADNEMRRAITKDPGEGSGLSRTHRKHDHRVKELIAALAQLGADVGSSFHDGPECDLIGVEIVDTTSLDNPPYLVGRKPAWALAQEERVRERRAAEVRAARDREMSKLAQLGMSIDEVRAALGKRATDETWSLHRCGMAARARVEIAGGHDGAALWGVALYGCGDEDTTYCIAVQGVGGADAARERWRAARDVLLRIGG